MAATMTPVRCYKCAAPATGVAYPLTLRLPACAKHAVRGRR